MTINVKRLSTRPSGELPDSNTLYIDEEGKLLVSGASGSGGGTGDASAAKQDTQTALLTSLDGKLPALAGSAMPVEAGNISTKFREAFENLNPALWTVSAGPGDIVAVDGNAVGASYLVVSKDPLTPNTATVIESLSTFSMPIELSVGLHMGQRTLGQQFAVEVVSTEVPLTAPADVALTSVSQTTTTLSATTATAHGLRAGQRIGLYGVSDARLNYSALVVATTPSPTTFTATAGPGGNLPSVTAGPFTSGFVTVRSAMGFAKNGSSMVFENASATNASVYVKSEGGDSMPIGGTAAGNHSVTINSTASTQAINAAITYSFRPTSEIRLALLADRLQWQDGAVDSTAQATARATCSQVVPDPSTTYKIRFRAENYRSLTIPNAQIVSVTKTGATTATVVCATPHGITVGDLITAYGVRDQVNFANLTTATAVASVVDAVTFTLVWGAAVTATSYGGFVSRSNGSQNIQGVVAQAVQSASATGGVLTLTGSANWVGVSIGDYVNLIGCRDASTGASLGDDGAYRVRDIATTNLVLEPIGSTPAVADQVSTNCGGAVIKRTDLRVSFVRVFDYERLRVEAISRPASDAAGAAPVTVQNTPSVTVSGTATVAGTVTANEGTQATGTAYTMTTGATTNAAVIKATAGNLNEITIANTSASTIFVKLYNKATVAPTVGTDVPIVTIPVVAGATVALEFGRYGKRFSSGIGLAVTAAMASADTTAVAAGSLVCATYL